MTRVCRECGEEKPIEEFYRDRSKPSGYNTICKLCGRKVRHEYFITHRDEVYRAQKENYQKYRPRHLKRCKQYYNEHLLVIKNRKHNKEQINMINLHYHIQRRTTSLISSKLKNNPRMKTPMQLLGCSIEEFKKHIESQFRPGMTWENWNSHGWHIDHKIPISIFDLSDPHQQEICFSWRNQQPLWATENMKKRNKLFFKIGA